MLATARPFCYILYVFLAISIVVNNKIIIYCVGRQELMSSLHEVTDSVRRERRLNARLDRSAATAVKRGSNL